MKKISDITKITMYRLSNTTVTSICMIVGLTISILMISIGISFTFEHVYAGNNKKENTPPNGSLYMILGQSDKKLSEDDVKNIFKNLRKDTGVIFNGIMVHVDKASINTYNPVSAEWFSEDVKWHYPLISGRYYTIGEIKNKKKVALIGKNLEKYIEDKNGKKYIHLGGEQYEVIGMIGQKDSRSLWDNRISIPATALPQKTEGKLELSSGGMTLILYNELGKLDFDKNNIEKNGKKLDKQFKIEYQGKIKTENMADELIKNQNPIYLLSVMGYVVTLIYSINTVMFWIEKRRYEIALRKAFGYTDKDIAGIILGELLGISGIAAFIAIIIQAILEIFIKQISDYTLRLYLPNILIALFIIFFTSILISIIPIIKAMKIPPVEVLKEGQSI